MFFSTSQAGAAAPEIGKRVPAVKDARDIKALIANEVLISCQGGDYTSEIYPKLRDAGWNGYWIDAASTLRLADDAIIVLDPVNREVIDRAVAAGVKNFIGGNCTVSLMLMATAGLFRAGLVEWITAMTYQAASGAGAPQMRELVAQMGHLHAGAAEQLADPASTILDVDRTVTDALRSPALPTAQVGYPLAGSLLPWIYHDLGTGQSKEEWKATPEANKILGLAAGAVPIEGICVRVGTMRCHSQALTIKLRRDLPLDGNRGADRFGARMGPRRPEHQGGQPGAVDAGSHDRHPAGADRSPAQAGDGRRIPDCVHGRRPAALGRGRAAAPDAPHPAADAGDRGRTRTREPVGVEVTAKK